MASTHGPSPATKETLTEELEVPRLSMHLGANYIRREYIRKNKPFVLTEAGVEEWRSWKEWRNGDQPNFPLLIDTYGTANGDITNCQSGQKLTLPISEFLHAWSISESPPPRYLKDFHFARDFPNYQAYIVPALFCDDWLNSWWTLPTGRKAWAKHAGVPHVANDYRFCYMGCTGTYTPLHHDVMYSFSWSASITGRKLWRIYRPCDKSKLWHSKHKEMLVEDSREGHYDLKDFPYVAEAKYVEVIQGPGEIIFVPSGWHHQVHNLDDCISINHNWLNACNLGMVWQYVKEKFEATEHIISHLKDGMEAAEFASQISRIMESPRNRRVN